MSGEVIFDEEEEQDIRRFVIRPLEPPKGLYRLFIRLGLAKDNAGVQRWLAGIAVVAVLVGFFYPLLFG